MEFVELRGGLVLPTEVIEFALALENRGIAFQAAGEVLRATSTTGEKPNLSAEDVAFIKARKGHLLALAGYQAPIPSTQSGAT